MPGERRFVVGGCVYRMAVDARHAGSLAATAAMAGPWSKTVFAGIAYQHTSNLPQGRALWLREQIRDTRLSWAVSVDGDTTWNPAQLIDELKVVDGQIAIGVAPTRIGGTASLCNVNILASDEQGGSERRAYSEELRRILDGDRLIASGGFGLAVFNLGWFRAVWPDPEPEGITLTCGEDIAMCRSVRARGGLIAALRVQTDHFAWGEAHER